LSERTGRCFNAYGFTEFRVTGSFTMEYAESFYFIERQIETSEELPDVEEH